MKDRHYYCGQGTELEVALIISSLQGGGAERVAATLVNAWVERGWTVTLITLGAHETDAYVLNPKVHRISLDLLRESKGVIDAVWNNMLRIHALRKALLELRPDVAISFMTTTNMLSILASFGTGIPMIVSERVSLVDAPPTAIWALLYRFLYRQATAVTTVTRRGASMMEARLGTSVTDVPNPVVIMESEQGGRWAHDLMITVPGQMRLIALGRLYPQKGFDLLIRAFAQIAQHHLQWSLIILGEGPQRSSLKGLAESLGIADRVILPGFCPWPHEVLKKADAFVLSSRFEGMPNALLEAMACGLPCVSFNCRTGPAELIEDGVDGLLVPAEDVPGLADALGRLFDDATLRDRLGTNAARALERFSIDGVIKRWERLLLLSSQKKLKRW